VMFDLDCQGQGLPTLASVTSSRGRTRRNANSRGILDPSLEVSRDASQAVMMINSYRTIGSLEHLIPLVHIHTYLGTL
jgi:hypothetical protein